MTGVALALLGVVAQGKYFFYHWIPILFGFYVGIVGTGWLLVHRLRGGEAPVAPRGIE